MCGKVRKGACEMESRTYTRRVYKKKIYIFKLKKAEHKKKEAC